MDIFLWPLLMDSDVEDAMEIKLEHVIVMSYLSLRNTECR